MRQRLAGLLVPIVLSAGIAACGGDSSGGEPGEGLTFTRADGSRFTLADPEVSCGPSVFTASGEEAIVIGQQEAPAERPSEPFFTIEGITADVEDGATVDLPTEYLDDDPSGALMFVYDSEGPNELSSSADGSSGTLELADVSCSPPKATVTVDATLGSEASDGEPLEVSGSIEASSGE